MDKKSYERAKELGRQAARSGMKPESSPYNGRPALRDLHNAWMEGWNEARAR